MFNIASPEMSVSAVFVKRSIQIWANKGHISSWWHVYSYRKSSFQVCARRIGRRCHNVNLRPRREYRGSTVTQYLGWQVRLRWWLNNEGVVFPMIVRSLASIQMSVLELIAYQTKYSLTTVFYLIKHYIFNAPPFLVYIVHMYPTKLCQGSYVVQFYWLNLERTLKSFTWLYYYIKMPQS